MIPADHRVPSAERRAPSRVSLIAALAENRTIGRAGGLPWHLPDDLKHFKRLTVDHTIIMGRKTYQEVNRPLPGRRNVVISRDSTFRPEGVTVVSTLEEALALGATEEEMFVIGGGEIYRLALPYADRLYLTIVHASVEGDTTFPRLDEGAWILEEELHHPADERHPMSFTFRTYVRLRSTT